MEILLCLAAATFFTTSLLGSRPLSLEARRRALKGCFFLTLGLSLLLSTLWSLTNLYSEDFPTHHLLVIALATLPIATSAAALCWLWGGNSQATQGTGLTRSPSC